MLESEEPVITALMGNRDRSQREHESLRLEGYDAQRDYQGVRGLPVPVGWGLANVRPDALRGGEGVEAV